MSPNRHRQRTEFRLVALGAAWLTIAIGGVTAAAWLSHSEWPGVLFPGMFEMKFNTSLAIAASGVGLLACVWRKTPYVIAAGAVALAFGGMALTEHIAGMGLGVDQLLLKDYRYPDSPTPGRTHPASAIGLIAAGIVLMLLAVKSKSKFPRFVAMELLSFAVAAIGVIGIAEHMTPAGFAHAWGGSFRIATPNAASFTMLGTGLLMVIWLYHGAGITPKPFWIPALLSLMVLLLDMSTPHGLEAGICYIPIMFYSLWFTAPHTPFIFAAIASALTALGHFATQPTNFDFLFEVTNRVMTIGSFWFVAILIYQRRQTEHALRDQKRRNQELDDFAYIAAHDLKEPLRGQLIHAQLLLEDYQDKFDEDGKRRLKRLVQLGQRMQQLVNDLLHFSRLGTSALSVQETDPNAIIADIRLIMEDFLKENCARIIVPHALPRIACDKAGVSEVFRNLITNAVKYNNKAERLMEIGFLDSVNTSEGGERNVFYVKDNGVGIETEFHEEIFRIFKRLQSVPDRQEAGTGVGLTFAKRIIERHGGRIWLRSEPGQGTTFYFNLNCEIVKPARHVHEQHTVPIPAHSRG